MEYQNRSAQATSTVDAGLREYMLKVYNFMAGGLGVTGLISYILFSYTAVYDYSGNLNVMATMAGSTIYQSPMIYLLMFAPLGVVMYMSFGIRNMSASRAQTMFWVFAVLMGLSLSTIFLQYTGASIARVFFITASTFGAMSIYGYTTKRDLTGMGSFLMMGLIGIIIASIVNMFMQS
ncbi:MAG: Bax inhibitor-1/YccA family protein, partial [Candidatus Puniceispirillales bacterium]